MSQFTNVATTQVRSAERNKPNRAESDLAKSIESLILQASVEEIKVARINQALKDVITELEKKGINIKHKSLD